MHIMRFVCARPPFRRVRIDGLINIVQNVLARDSMATPIVGAEPMCRQPLTNRFTFSESRVLQVPGSLGRQLLGLYLC